MAEFQGRVSRGGAKNAELSDPLYQIRETEVMSVSRRCRELALGSDNALEAGVKSQSRYKTNPDTL